VLEERAGEQVIQSRYDAAGNRISRRTALGHETAYDHDGNGDLLAVTFGMNERWMDFSPDALAKHGAVRAPWKAIFERDAMGQEQERRLPGGVVGRWTRDTSGRPVVHRVVRAGGAVLGTGYHWRSLEQLAALIDTREGATLFEHDARSYLVAATSPDGSVQHRAPTPSATCTAIPSGGTGATARAVSSNGSAGRGTSTTPTGSSWRRSRRMGSAGATRGTTQASSAR